MRRPRQSRHRRSHTSSPAATLSGSRRPAQARPRLSRCRFCNGWPTNGQRVPRRGCRALVLAPTRELASQINESFRVYGGGMKLSSTVVFGGVAAGPQNPRARRRGRHRCRHAGPAAGSPRAWHCTARSSPDPGPRRGRPDAGYGLHPAGAPRSCARPPAPGRRCCSRRRCRAMSASSPRTFSRSR